MLGSKGKDALRRASPAQRRGWLGGALVLAVSGLAGAALAEAAESGSDRSRPASEHADRVACLLPAEITRLGQQLTMLSARQKIETSRADCEARSGEVVGAPAAVPEPEEPMR